MTVKLFIDGAAGTTGLDIRERIAGHGEIALITLSEAQRKDSEARCDALNSADVVILCLPDDAAREAVALIENAAVKVIDASTAHRIADGWLYGFAELEPDRREALANASRISNPGCYPTGFLALIRPLIREGLIPADWPFTVNATSGYSGGGKAMIAAYENPSDPAATDTAFRIYALTLAHKHVSEMQHHAQATFAPLFAPAVARTYRGMIVEVPLQLAAMRNPPKLNDIRDALRDAYNGSKLVQVQLGEQAELLTLEQCANTDRLELHVFGNEKTGQARLVATLDNLGKGAGGAGVQNLNIALGFDEMLGLTL